MKNNLKKGDSAIEVLKFIVDENPSITSIFICEFPPNRILQERISFDETLSQIFNESMQIRHTYNLPFWESLSLSLIGKDFKHEELFREILFHNNNDVKMMIHKEDLNTLYDFLKLETKSMFTINSLVICENDNTLHIPMIDFHIPISFNNYKIVKNVVLSINQSGFILESGKSYHFYGKKLMTQDELTSFLYKILLFSPITDKNWATHQLIEKKCNLRFNEKNGILPKLIDEI